MKQMASLRLNQPLIHRCHRFAVDRENSNPKRIAMVHFSSSRRVSAISAAPTAAAGRDSAVEISSSRRNPSSKRLPRLSSTSTESDSSVSTAFSENRSSDNNGALFSGRLDEWMRDSVVEIVTNLRQAPLLVQIYASGNGRPTRLETEKAVAEEWPAVTRRWKDGEAPSPDGVILVEEIGGEEQEEEDGGGDTTAWGIVVQGKGKECGPVCYVMKTTRVGSGLGSGCTHFCLVKVEGLRESALSQLARCWLLG